MSDEPNSALVYEMIAQHNETLIEMRDMISGLLEELRIQKERHEECKAKLHSAFPDGDTDLHRREHEEMIKAREARTEMMREATKAIIKWGAVGIAAYVCIAMWHEGVNMLRVLLK